MSDDLRITVSGRRLDVERIPGDPSRAVLVLLHEGLGSIGLWRGLPERLAQATARTTLAFSRFGHGRSEPPPEPRTPAFFHSEALEVLPSVLEQLGVAEAILVGHSDGASIAIVHAAEHPVAGLVLIAPHVFVERICVDAIAETRDAYREGDLRDRMARHHDDPDAAFWGWCDVWLDPDFREWTLDGEVARLSVPTLLVQGAADPYGTLEQIDRIQRLAPVPVQRLVLDGGGHSPHLDEPIAVVERIASFAATLT